MGNEISSPQHNHGHGGGNDNDNETNSDSETRRSNRSNRTAGYSEFLSSAGKTISHASGIVCGSLADTFEEPDRRESSRSNSNSNSNSNLGDSDDSFSPRTAQSGGGGFGGPNDEESLQSNPMSKLFAKAMLSEVTDNPSTMTPSEMAQREKKLLRAQESAKQSHTQGGAFGAGRPIGAPGASRILPPNMLMENRAQVGRGGDSANGSGSSAVPHGKHRVTIGLSLSRRNANVGHPDTVTRQTAFDFNELQDRSYKYISSTDSTGWRAGGGERGAVRDALDANLANSHSLSDEMAESGGANAGASGGAASGVHKVAAPDTVHIPIIHIDCESPSAVESIIAALARGEVFIPHMSVMPEALGVNGISPPDLVVRFGCERTEDVPPEVWPNWCLEFMHNQLYDYFSPMGAQWMKRPFQITLAKKVRWKTVKHMNKFFSHSESVIQAWRDKGAQHLDPQLNFTEGGAASEEVARPHGIYLMRNGRPTNYFAPNFEPPYTTKMTRSLLSNVINKSWDQKRRDWSSEPIARAITPSMLISTMCGCAEANQGFLANEATNKLSPFNGEGFFGDVSVLNNHGKNHNSQSLQGLKTIHREDSGIRRSEIGDGREGGRRGRSRNGRGNSNSRSSSKRRSSRSSSRRRTESMDNSFGHEHEDTFNMNNTNNQSSIDRPDQHSSGFSDPQALPHQNEAKEGHFLNNARTPKQEGFQHGFDDYNDLEQIQTAYVEKDTPIIDNRMSNRNQIQKNRIPEDEEADHQMASFHDHERSHFSDVQKKEGSSAPRISPTEHGSHNMGVSVGESQTTVPIMNGFAQQERERRKEREAEREIERKKMDQLEMAIKEKMKVNREKLSESLEDGIGGSVRSKGGGSKSSKKEKKAKKERKKREKKERKQRERSRDQALKQKSTNVDTSQENEHIEKPRRREQMASENEIEELSVDPKPQEQQPAPIIRSAGEHFQQNESSLNSKGRMDYDSSYLPLNLSGKSGSNSKNAHVFANNSPRRGDHPEITSKPSLDYSVDTASLLGDGSLLGGQFAGDGSVMTMGTSASDNRSLLSCVTRSTVHDMSGHVGQDTKPRSLLGSPRAESDDDDISLSLLASSSSGMEPIPADEELFAIGWAKAMDPSSGSYYYFTLDRTKTVWDNPLLSYDA